MYESNLKTIFQTPKIIYVYKNYQKVYDFVILFILHLQTLKHHHKEFPAFQRMI